MEKSSGKQILKCGVTHSGQRFQYSKFLDITNEIRTRPRAIFVFYFSNDVANDYVYPHSTVMQGWQVDSVKLDRKLDPVIFISNARKYG